MLHGSVIKVDLEPVPDGDGRAGKSQDVLHSAPVIWIWTVRLSMRRVRSVVNAADGAERDGAQLGCRPALGRLAAIPGNRAGLYQQGCDEGAAFQAWIRRHDEYI